ncbi:hypothetical protein EVAR_38664_1 [Eumeta japonica]|uniref:Uncharacterized protein n=1 Tax=Eumeta variegata TaxID=151549 RepID=A0A4C1Y1K0_EUMVA|nr:hypothetical protein EVAR_38664_1 [Eumeta japonica]
MDLRAITYPGRLPVVADTTVCRVSRPSVPATMDGAFQKCAAPAPCGGRPAAASALLSTPAPENNERAPASAASARED